jgi:ketosteroid isomerase-like protein
MPHASMADFAARWADAWNRRAIEEILDHFHDEVVFTSPTALAVVGTPVVRGKPALRAYWNQAMTQIESLRFTVHRALWDPSLNELAILYTAQINGRGKRVSENLTFDALGTVVSAEVFHGVSEP